MIFPCIVTRAMVVNTGAVEVATATNSRYGTETIGAGKPFTDIQAMWIWVNSDTNTASTLMRATFSTTISASAQGMQALLHLIVDDAAEIFLNGALIGSLQLGWLASEGKYAYINRPVRLTLALGTNILSVRVTNKAGPAALLASIFSSDGSTVLARTTGAWTYSVDAANAPGKCYMGLRNARWALS